MNSLVLFIDSKSALKSVRYEEIIDIFRESVEKFTKPKAVPLVTFVYPWDKPGFYGDVTQRFEDDIGSLTKEQIKFPALAFTHAESSSISVYPHSLHKSQISWETIGSWAVLQAAKLDLEYFGSKIIELKVEIGKAPGEKQIEKIQPELDSLAAKYASIEKLVPLMEDNFNTALQNAKWGAAMEEAGVTTPEERAEFIEKAEARLKDQLEVELKAAEDQMDEEKDQAMAAVADLVNALDKQLIEEGMDDEVQRYQTIMKKLEEEEERLLTSQNKVEELDDEEDKSTVKEEL